MKAKTVITYIILTVLFVLLFTVFAFAELGEEQQQDTASGEETASIQSDSSSEIETEAQTTDSATTPEEENTEKPEDGEEEKATPAPEKSVILDGKLIEDPVFVILDNKETLWLSIGEKELREYVDFFRKEMNMNTAAIAGVLGNLQYESGFNPNKIGDFGYAYGLCQWRGARLDAMVEFCYENGLNPITSEGQLYYLKHEFENSYRFAADYVCDTIDNLDGAILAAEFFCRLYEVPADPDQVLPERQKLITELIYPLLTEWEEN